MASLPKDALAGATPADLAWIAGSWVGRNGDDRVEEHWSPLAGDTLVGTFRWVHDGRVRFYEILVVERDGPAVVLRIKHFDPGLIGWEEREKPHELVLVALADRMAVFLERDRPEPRYVVYRREGDDRLLSYFMRDDGTVTETGTFEYVRQ